MHTQADERIGKIFKAVVELPSLPVAVERLVQLSDKDAMPRDFASIVENDQGLAVKVLRLANSAFYALPRPTSSLRHACALLGTKTLKSLALSFGVVSMFRKAFDGLEPLPFWRHAIAVAIAAQRMAKLWNPERDEDLYMAGLLHDAGVPILAQHIQEYHVVLKHARLHGVSLSQVEQGAHSVSHAEVAWGLATRWRLSPLVCDALRFHETPPGSWALCSPDHAAAVAIVQCADQLTSRMEPDLAGCGWSEKQAWAPPDALPITPAQLEQVLTGLPQAVVERERILWGDESPSLPVGQPAATAQPA